MTVRNYMAGMILLTALLPANAAIAGDRAEQVKTENQPVADQGDGTYRNPILAGNYGDPSVVKVGEDYYMAFSRGEGFILWHSRDLVNWAPLLRHTFKDIGNIWAVDLKYVDDKFFLYLPVGEVGGKPVRPRVTWVTTAERPEGPWSEPVDTGMRKVADDRPGYHWGGIDPGLVVTPEGEKYLYVNNGWMAPMDRSGLRVTAKPTRVHQGWPIPPEWVIECFCLESPKFFRKDGWYYLVSAQGGTSGPSTAHMATVARSRYPVGPWEESPYNPLVRTWNPDEKWWQQGHATLVEGPGGRWWAIYHARQGGYTRHIGRQVLMLPLEWTEDGWPVVPEGVNAADALPLPQGENVGHGMPISDDFSGDGIGMQWKVDRDIAGQVEAGQGALKLKAAGETYEEANFISVMAINPDFEAQVKVEVPPGVIAGISFGNGDGIKTDGKSADYTTETFWRVRFTEMPLTSSGTVWLKLRNYRGDLSYAASNDGVNWTPFHNALHAPDYTIRLFAHGEGTAVFSDFRYRGL